MRIAFRVDASTEIGTGHVMRCLVLAQVLAKLGCHVVFIAKMHQGHLNDYIMAQGFSVYGMSVDADYLGQGYLAWLGSSQQDDAMQFVDLALKLALDVVVVDHYAIDRLWQRQVSQVLDVKLVIIDDLANRYHDCDVLLDQNLWPNPQLRYRQWLCRETMQLIGPKYALLRASFQQLRANAPDKQNKVIAFFGGTDPTGECLKLLRAAATFIDLPFKLVVVTGRGSSLDMTKVSEFQQPFIACYSCLTEFDTELATAKYGIGAAGSTTWERFCLNVPSSLVVVADNQKASANYLAQQGLITFLGEAQDITTVTYQQELIRLCKEWSTISLSKGYDVDGLGAKRVAETILLLR